MAGQVAWMGKLWSENLKRKDQLQYLGIDGEII
jgi:hypothetical protein